MKFWDASALVPLLVEEPATRRVRALVSADASMLVWWASEIECASALARLERDDALTAKAAEIAAREDGAFMGLGGNSAPKPKTESAPLKSSPNPDWIRRAFDR